jgi:hypothetical protein
MKILDGATATGAGLGIRVRNTNNHALQCVFTGTATALTVDLEGSLDDATWFQIGQKAFSAGELSAKAALLHVVDKPIAYIRANVTALTGTPTAINCWYESGETQGG